MKFFKSPSKILIPLAVIGLLVFLFVNLQDKKRAPEVVFSTIEGKKISMSSLKGQMVLVNFWATDCPGCIAEMPKLVETYNKYHSKGLELIAIAMPEDQASQVLNYAQKNKLPFPVMHDAKGDVTDQFEDVRLTPTTFIIDQQSHIMGKIIGEMDFKALNKMLDQSLAQNTGKAL
ncbi:MAG: TlpA family protein disulfide reductase [Methylophilaceae bacterium]|nr:TlpA family protein disulfide reductase [Methylophilaceae bacterium]